MGTVSAIYEVVCPMVGILLAGGCFVLVGIVIQKREEDK